MYQIKTRWASVLSFSWLNQTDSTETTQDPPLWPHCKRQPFRKHHQDCCSDTEKEIFPISGCPLESLGDLEKKKIWAVMTKKLNWHFWVRSWAFSFFWWGKCEIFKVPQVILFSLTTLSSVWDTSSQIREQTLVTPPHLSAVWSVESQPLDHQGIPPMWL